MKLREVFVSVLTFGGNTDGEYQLIVFGIETPNWIGALLHVGGVGSQWQFDLFWMRSHILKLYDWWKHG